MFSVFYLRCGYGFYIVFCWFILFQKLGVVDLCATTASTTQNITFTYW